MDRLLQLVDEALQEAIPEFLLTEARSTTDAFSIETPYRACRAVVWLLNPRVFSIRADGAGLLQRLLHRWVDAVSGRASFARGPDENPMLEVFPDLLAAQTVLQAGDRTSASAFGDLSVKDLLEWAARERAGIAFWLPSSGEQRRCIHLPPDRVRALSGRRQG